jgi:hypothetical protein
MAGGRSFPYPFPTGRATVAPGDLDRLAALINRHPVRGLICVICSCPACAAVIFGECPRPGRGAILYGGMLTLRKRRHVCRILKYTPLALAT